MRLEIPVPLKTLLKQEGLQLAEATKCDQCEVTIRQKNIKPLTLTTASNTRRALPTCRHLKHG